MKGKNEKKFEREMRETLSETKMQAKFENEKDKFVYSESKHQSKQKTKQYSNNFNIFMSVLCFSVFAISVFIFVFNMTAQNNIVVNLICVFISGASFCFDIYFCLQTIKNNRLKIAKKVIEKYNLSEKIKTARICQEVQAFLSIKMSRKEIKEIYYYWREDVIKANNACMTIEDDYNNLRGCFAKHYFKSGQTASLSECEGYEEDDFIVTDWKNIDEEERIALLGDYCDGEDNKEEQSKREGGALFEERLRYENSLYFDDSCDCLDDTCDCGDFADLLD